MKKMILILLVAVFLNLFYGCCGGFGASGTDCTNYKASQQIYINFNLDSSNNGFKVNELDSTYCIVYQADSVNNFVIPIDTFTIVNASRLEYSQLTNYYTYDVYLIDNQLDAKNRQLEKSLKIFNSNSNKVYELTNIEVELLQNEKKCCQEYSDNNIKSFKLNGVPYSGNTVITLNKK